MWSNDVFRKEVALQAILYIAQKVERKDIYKICKILYFADREHLSRYGRSITGDTYIAMAFGPVPSKVDDIFKAVRGDSYFSDCAGDLKEYFEFVNWFIIKPKKEADLDYLSATDIECLDGAIALCKDKDFVELTNLSHDLAWQNTQRDRAMSVKDIIREAGEEEDYVDYVFEKLKNETVFHHGFAD